MLRVILTLPSYVLNSLARLNRKRVEIYVFSLSHYKDLFLLAPLSRVAGIEQPLQNHYFLQAFLKAGFSVTSSRNVFEI